jgi:hypothetical protein
MRLVPLRNDSGSRLVFQELLDVDGTILVFEVGQTKNVAPATVAHPAVRRYIGRGLTKGEDNSAPKKAQQAPPRAETPIPLPATEPVDEPADELVEESTVSEPEEPADSIGTDTLRETYLRAPGITEDNVDDTLEAFPTPEDLSGATKNQLIDVGVSKSYVKRLKQWAAAH